jgi:hypothetical protein
VTAIASHAGTRITYWELWNEPQDPEYYCGDMQTLLTMAQHAYGIIKSINPAAQVITPTGTAADGPHGSTPIFPRAEGTMPTSFPSMATAIRKLSPLTSWCRGTRK